MNKASRVFSGLSIVFLVEISIPKYLYTLIYNIHIYILFYFQQLTQEKYV